MELIFTYGINLQIWNLILDMEIPFNMEFILDMKFIFRYEIWN